MAIPILILALSCVFPALYFKKRFEEVFPLVLVFLAVFLYPFGFSGRLDIGLAIFCVLGVSSAVWILFKHRKQFGQLAHNLWNYMITPGFFVFLALCVFFGLLFEKRLLFGVDEIAFWGPFAKETLRLDAFYNILPDVVSVHLNYPPGAPLLEYAWIKLSLGDFSDSQIMIAFHVLCAAFMLPLLRKLTFQRPIPVVSAALAIFFAPMVLYLGYYTEIVPDVLVGLCFGFSAFLIIDKNWKTPFNLIGLSLALSYLVLLKEIGIFFAAFAILMLLARCLSLKKFSIKTGGLCALALFLPFLLRYTWSVHVKDMASQFHISDILDPQKYIALLEGSAPAYQYEIIDYFLKLIFTPPSLSRHSPVYGSGHVFWMLTMAALSILFALVFAAPKDRRRLAFGNALLFVGGLLYAASMLALYLFSFSQEEGARLASFERYMNAYLIGYFLFVGIEIFSILGTTLLPSAPFFNKHARTRRILEMTAPAAMSLCILASIPIYSYETLDTAIVSERNAQGRHELNRYAQKIRDAGVSADDRLYIVSVRSSGYDYWVLKYELLPVRTNPIFSWSIGQPYGNGDYWTSPMTLEQFESTLLSGGYSYVWLMDIEEPFAETFAPLLSEGEIEGATLLRVDTNAAPGHATLIRVM